MLGYVECENYTFNICMQFKGKNIYKYIHSLRANKIFSFLWLLKGNRLKFEYFKDLLENNEKNLMFFNKFIEYKID